MNVEEMKQMLKEIEEKLETQAPYFDDRLLGKERELKRLIAKEE
tara:strand:- start:428 stop:559 length:132 start_codon:yes stop_codon:yes gene_type:complete